MYIHVKRFQPTGALHCFPRFGEECYRKSERIFGRYGCRSKKRQRTGALQKLAHTRTALVSREASWSAAVLWRFPVLINAPFNCPASRRANAEIPLAFAGNDRPAERKIAVRIELVRGNAHPIAQGLR